MAEHSTVHLDLGPLKRFERQIGNGLHGTGSSVRETRDMFTAWGAIFRGAMQERYLALSAGGTVGGTKWAKLSPATIDRRRIKAGGRLRTKSGKRRRFRRGASSAVGRRPRILRDLGILFASYTPDLSRKPGQYEKRIIDGLRVGIGGSGQHRGAKMTVGRLAVIHHEGKGRNPARPLIARPSRRTWAKMIDVAMKTFQRMGN